ncbi:hypothetical protein GRS48_00870 [Halorubrum sp. JWXQ-INN 858]|uniref:DUF7093 family protein n=1 Tax=Halorubrum sp. JWXQ-INN 858 TaxID=2690782 RepID=UPI00135A0782|nr:hypothetical protein [Halorubrum sp. JWXQ-INN 858]MWV63386.1 hypothetical protein [Halorubrum sp. JWXQ-INN 858]
MGLRCLLGHDFGEPEVERERAEDGNEVVTTLREVKTCARCGETQIVSENTEVTTVKQLAEVAAEAAEADANADVSTSAPADAPAPTAEPDDAPVGPAADRGEGPAADPVDDSEYAAAAAGSGDDAEIIDDGPDVDGSSDVSGEASGATAETTDTDTVDADAANADVGGAGASGSEAGSDADAPDTGVELIDDGPDGSDADDVGSDRSGDGSDSPNDDAVDPVPTDADAAEVESAGDDGVILDADGEEPAAERERGAWPAVDADADPAAEPTPWPDPRGEDEGFSAEVAADDDAGGRADVEFGGGLTPEAGDRVDHPDDGETEFVEAPEGDATTFDAGAAGDAGADLTDTGITREGSPELRTSVEDAETEYYCPECGMVREADGVSMRPGDICPECKRGYVAERPI